MKQGLPNVPTWKEWALDQAKDGKNVGVDPTLITQDDAKKLQNEMTEKGCGKLVGISDNLVDKIWGTDRPKRPSEIVYPVAEKYSGKSFSDKVKDLRVTLDKKQAAGMVVSMLDDVAWLFNLRGSDIPYNPVFFAYALVTQSYVTLFIDSSKCGKDVRDHLGSDAQMRPYGEIFKHIEAFGTEIANANPSSQRKKILLSSKGSWALATALGGEKALLIERSPITDSKAVKNAVEKDGMRNCHIRDGAALIRYFAWLENELLEKKSKLDEVEGADKLESFRKEVTHFAGLSFDTISATGSNAAIIHYGPKKDTCAIINPQQMYLCDSGAQYRDGTTDTTRTLTFVEPQLEQKKAYTLVLKGHIAISQTVFPKGTTGFMIDVLARQFLWKNGLDYLHGTGHGVGSHLCVHEGPAGIGTRIAFNDVALAPGMVLSNEPGFYKDGAFGIRIENVVIVKEVYEKGFSDQPYYGFEHVTMAPMSQKLIDVQLLTQSELDWLNSYHQEVRLLYLKIYPNLAAGICQDHSFDES